jgi:hypothetical protein
MFAAGGRGDKARRRTTVRSEAVVKALSDVTDSKNCDALVVCVSSSLL